MVCLDTSFIADINRNNPDALGKLKEFVENKEHLSTTVINVGELYKGAYSHHNREEKLKEVDELTQILFIFEMNVTASKSYGYYYQYLKERGEIVGDRDIFIASIILSFGEDKIITRNIEHFRRIPGIVPVTY